MNAQTLLDIFEAISEVRIEQPSLRPSVLSALRLACSENTIKAGRLYVLGTDKSIKSIISHGGASQAEENDRAMVERILISNEPETQGEVSAYPLGRFGVLFLECAVDNVGSFLASLFLQWCAVNEYLEAQKEELLDENFHLREEIRVQFSDQRIIGVSGSFRHALENAKRVAASTATVLIHGETGTGKELIARTIHEHSPRSNEAFITVNCGALSESLLESELFGHIKGAFTGATSDRKGRFEAADNGTIFLDEIGEISQNMQVRLLRVLQEMEIVRVGDHKVRKLNVRVIAATNRDLDLEVREGRFRSDLYYRLNVVFIHSPALRDRPEDIPPLVEHFLGIYSQRNLKYIEHFSRDVIEAMKKYPWPGNVRELENCIEKMVVMAPGKHLTMDLLPMSIMAYTDPSTQMSTTPLVTETALPQVPTTVVPALPPDSIEGVMQTYLHEQTDTCLAEGNNELYNRVRSKWERHLFEVVLNRLDNNKSRAATLLGITRNTLNSRMNAISTIKREWNIE